MKNIIPFEIVNIIIDYIDYLKYHKLEYKEILNDLNDFSSCFVNDNNLPPSIAYQCWGIGEPGKQLPERPCKNPLNI